MSPSAIVRRRAIRGRLLDFPTAGGYRLRSDHLLVIEDGRIAAVGPAASLLSNLPPGTPIDAAGDRLVLPGFVDAHIHFPQSRVIAAPARDLLDWLERWTFPAERAYADPEYAARMAGFFFDELLRQGTTTAVVFGSVHAASVEALFDEAHRRGLRLLAGKVMMDRGPEGLRDTVEEGVRETLRLIERWHGVGRLGYVITPRFALTSSEDQLQAAGELLRARPDCWLQTHLAESPAEIARVKDLFPWSWSYVGVYDRFGLLGGRSLFGHCVHVVEGERERLWASGSVAVLCPTSNCFLGSGVVDIAALSDPVRPVRLALGTDVGGGTSWSMLRTAAVLHDLARLRGHAWGVVDSFRLITAGNAEALGLGDRIGRLEPGFEADLVVLEPRASLAMAHRLGCDAALEEELAVLLWLGDERAVWRVYVAGEPVAGCDAAAGGLD